jgi:multidrug efflux pump subunit AcrA (membrane-fusion protein)
MTELGVCPCTFGGGTRKLAPFGLLLLAISVFTACGHTNASAPQGPPAMPVKVQAVQDHPIGDSSEYVATIKSRHSATINSDVEGWIFDIHVHSGQMVKKGDTLMEIDPRRQVAMVSNIDSQRKSKEAALAWAKSQYDRTTALAASGVMSKQDLE